MSPEDLLIKELQLPLDSQVIETRRDIHRFPELGWCEFRTASKIVRTLEALDLEVSYGREVLAPGSRMGVPPIDELQAQWRRALQQGADCQLESDLAGGFTAVVGTLRGLNPGPVIAFRFDIDANTIYESLDQNHFPRKHNFASQNVGVHHNCGHDGHAAIGLTLARLLSSERKHLTGEVRLIFQPAEEGLRGAKAMVDAGVLEGVERLVSLHIGVQAQNTGILVAGYQGLFSSIKFDVTFKGRNAHAALSPHEGKNALLAAVVAVQNLLAISRHGQGDSRVNVGTMRGGEARNSIPAHAELACEVRGEDDNVANYMWQRARQIITHAAEMFGVEWAIEVVGESPGADSSNDFCQVIGEVAAGDSSIIAILPSAEYRASDDVARMMRFVQEAGGSAAYIGIGANLAGVHHSPEFDFDETCLGMAVRLLHRLTMRVSRDSLQIKS